MSLPTPAFAADSATAAYYEQRAREYDEWYAGVGRFKDRDRPGWTTELENVIELVRQLPPSRTLDVACGTGYLTRHLRGLVLAVDRSPTMVAIAQPRMPNGIAIVGDALHLAIADHAFDRVFTSHFYGHLPGSERSAFLVEVRRVAHELIVVDSAKRDGVQAREWQERILNDGSAHRVFKRYLSGHELAEEIDGEILLEGTWFVAARAAW